MTHGERLFRQIREARRSRKIQIKAASARAGMHESYWTDLEMGRRPLASATSLVRMAEAIGLRVDLVPESTPERPVTAPGPPPPPEPTRAGGISPTLRRITERIRGAREAAGLTQAQAAARAGWEKSTWGNLERGYFPGRVVGVDRIGSAARAVGLTLDVFDAPGAVLADVDADEAYAIRELIRWYAKRAPRLPAVLASVEDKITKALEQ